MSETCKGPCQSLRGVIRNNHAFARELRDTIEDRYCIEFPARATRGPAVRRSDRSPAKRSRSFVTPARTARPGSSARAAP